MSKQAQFVFGFHAVNALLKTSPDQVEQAYLLKGRKDQRFQQVQQLLESLQVKLQWANRKLLDDLVSGNHQGLIVQTRPNNLETKAESYDEEYLKSQLPKLMGQGVVPFILILDGVTDPHNLGACLRSAEAAGVQFVIIPKDNSASLTATAIKVACGAAEALPLIRVTNLSRTMQWLQQQGIWLLGAAGEADQHHYQMDFTGPLALVMGSEGKGLRRLTRENCDALLSIPMMGSLSSLNVSVATGICLFEALRQRELKIT